MTSYESSGLEKESLTKYMDLINKIQENGYGKNIYSMIERAIVNNQQFEVAKSVSLRKEVWYSSIPGCLILLLIVVILLVNAGSK